MAHGSSPISLNNMTFLYYFGKSKNKKIIVYDIYTFNNLFSLLLHEQHSHEDALNFIMTNCDLNAYVFQGCIHNKSYLKLTPKNINYEEAGRRSKLHELALSFII